jgi:hypothetical protein
MLSAKWKFSPHVGTSSKVQMTVSGGHLEKMMGKKKRAYKTEGRA